MGMYRKITEKPYSRNRQALKRGKLGKAGLGHGKAPTSGDAGAIINQRIGVTETQLP